MTSPEDSAGLDVSPAPSAPPREASCWRDVRCPGPGPAVWLTGGLCWLAFATLLVRFGPGADELWVALVFAAIPLAVLPAVHAARRLSNPARMGALREASGIARSQAAPPGLGSAARRGLLGAHAVPVAVLGLVMPAYALIAMLGAQHGMALAGRLGAALAFWLNAAVCPPPRGPSPNPTP